MSFILRTLLWPINDDDDDEVMNNFDKICTEWLRVAQGLVSQILVTAALLTKD